MPKPNSASVAKPEKQSKQRPKHRSKTEKAAEKHRSSKSKEKQKSNQVKMNSGANSNSKHIKDNKQNHIHTQLALCSALQLDLYARAPGLQNSLNYQLLASRWWHLPSFSGVFAPCAMTPHVATRAYSSDKDVQDLSSTSGWTAQVDQCNGRV